MQDGLPDIRQVCAVLKSQAAFQAVSVHCGYGAAHSWFLQIYPEIQQAFPDHDIQFVVSQTEAAADRLDADVSFVLGSPEDPAFQSEQVIHERITLACSPEFHCGRGICIVWPQLSADYFDSGRLIALPETEIQSENGYFLVSRTRHHVNVQFSRCTASFCQKRGPGSVTLGGASGGAVRVNPLLTEAAN